VGHPIAAAVTEGLVDLAAEAMGMDPVEIRRRNLIADDAYPYTSPAKMRFEGLSHHASLDKLLEMMDYDGLRAEQAELRARASIAASASPASSSSPTRAPFMYGIGGARISAQDGCTVRMDPDGSVVACRA
jgi:aerobic carbon-monoxide dehydrogenase large subunit